ncbi:hypothetical protein RJT34_10078 [Clitoria ternatea]|uniref:Uncharacterized protein n=1 Tax=Clitoria ternatea TaxID=43366 RepID=A0AAN9PVG9_CLITE
MERNYFLTTRYFKGLVYLVILGGCIRVVARDFRSMYSSRGLSFYAQFYWNEAKTCNSARRMTYSPTSGGMRLKFNKHFFSIFFG